MNDGSSARIAAELRRWIEQAPPSARLPSTRALVARYAASPVTVQKALHALTAQGLIESRPGVGTFVRAVRTARPLDHSWQTGALGPRPATVPALPTPLRTGAVDAIGLHAGYPARELLPERLVRAALARAARSDAALVRAPAEGSAELRAWFADELAEATAPGTTPPSARDVLVVPGSQSALSSIFRAVVGPGQAVVMESPTYWGAILAAAHAGVRVVPVPGGAGGPDPGEVSRAFERTGARVLYAQPTYANPTGAQWSPQRAQQVLDVVRAHGAFVVEDDWAHDFGIDTEPAPLAARDDAGHVIYLRSLTKSVSPAVRVAAVVARGPARERILTDCAAESMYVSSLLQAAALEVVTHPGWATHRRGLRHQLRARRDLLAGALARHLPQAHLDHVPPGGLNLWARLPQGTDLDQLARDCESDGVLIAAGTQWFPAEPSGPCIRLNYAGPDPDRFPDAVQVIAHALAHQQL